MKLECEITDEQMWKLYEQLTDEQKDNIIKWIIYDDLIIKIWKMLTEIDYDWYWWNTSGWRSGSEIREAIAKIQGIEIEYRKDKESIISTLSANLENAKKYESKLLELYHSWIIKHEHLPK